MRMGRRGKQNLNKATLRTDDLPIILEICKEQIEPFSQTLSREHKRKINNATNPLKQVTYICINNFMKTEFLKFSIDRLSGLNVEDYTDFNEIIDSDIDEKIKALIIIYIFSTDRETSKLYEETAAYKDLVGEYLVDQNQEDEQEDEEETLTPEELEARALLEEKEAQEAREAKEAKKLKKANKKLKKIEETKKLRGENKNKRIEKMVKLKEIEDAKAIEDLKVIIEEPEEIPPLEYVAEVEIVAPPVETVTPVPVPEPVEVNTEENNVVVKQKTYIGKTEIVLDHFCNFIPEYTYENNKVGINYNRDDKFGGEGKVKLYEYPNTNFVELRNDNIIGNYIACTFDVEDTEETGDTKVPKKININKVKIHSLGDFEIYRIANNDDSGNHIVKEDQLILEPKEYTLNEKVIVRYYDGNNAIYLPPTEVFFREFDQCYYIKTDIKLTNVVTGYNEKQINSLKAFNSEYGEDLYVNLSRMTEDEQILLDSMNINEILLNLIKDSNSNYANSEFVAVSKIESLIENANPNVLLNSDRLTKNILDKRKKQLIERLYMLRDEGAFVDKALDVICEILLNSDTFKGNQNLQDLIYNILDDENIIKSMQGFNIVDTRVANLRKEKEQLLIDISELKEDKNSRSMDVTETLETISTVQIEQLKKEKEEIKVLLDDIKSEYGEYKELKDLEEAISKAKSDFETFNKMKNDINTEIDTIIKQDFIKKRSLEISTTKNNPSNTNYRACYEQLTRVEPSFSHFEFGEHVVEKIQQVRHYSADEIINVFASIYTGFITIFSGKPGTGKTSICNIISKVLGMDKFGQCGDVNLNRFVPISVERGWTSKKDLLGYFNPLTKVFDKNNKHLFDALSVQNEEILAGNNKFPLFVLLDEANLSPIEYYWGDFMKIADFDNDVSNDLNLGNDLILKVADKLRFLATINNDHTTEDISPRLLDRAWVVELSMNDANDAFERTDYGKLDSLAISWNTIEKYFDNNKVLEIDSNSKRILNELYSLCNQNDLPISRRSKGMMTEYIKITERIYKDGSSKALDFAIAQKIIPTIMGSGEKYCSFLEDLNTLCEQNRLTKSTTMLEKIIANGKDNMHDFYFFR